MVVACKGRQLFKTGKLLAFPRTCPLGPYNSSLCASSMPLVRLWCSSRRLHYSKETTRPILTKLSPQEVLLISLSHASVIHENLAPLPLSLEKPLETKALKPTERTFDVLLAVIQGLLSGIQGLIEGLLSGFLELFGGLFSGSLVLFLSILRNVGVANLKSLFKLLKGFTLIKAIPFLYLPLLVGYVGLAVTDAVLYLILNPYSDTPDDFLGVAGTLIGMVLDLMFSL